MAEQDFFDKLTADRADLVTKARDYAQRGLFAGLAHNTATSVLGQLDKYGKLSMSQWVVLARCVGQVDARPAGLQDLVEKARAASLAEFRRWNLPDEMFPAYCAGRIDGDPR